VRTAIYNCTWVPPHERKTVDGEADRGGGLQIVALEHATSSQHSNNFLYYNRGVARKNVKSRLIVSRRRHKIRRVCHFNCDRFEPQEPLIPLGLQKALSALTRAILRSVCWKTPPKCGGWLITCT